MENRPVAAERCSKVALFVPIYESAGITGIGSRVAESGPGLITPYQWSGPYEDVRLKL
jgi:hypothetical protein